jgi:hypothetical protein
MIQTRRLAAIAADFAKGRLSARGVNGDTDREWRLATQPVWKQREIAMLADSGWSETALES